MNWNLAMGFCLGGGLAVAATHLAICWLDAALARDAKELHDRR